MPSKGYGRARPTNGNDRPVRAPRPGRGCDRVRLGHNDCPTSGDGCPRLAWARCGMGQVKHSGHFDLAVW